MDAVFRVDPELNIPIYRQLVDRIRAAVKKGELTNDQQLPTVQEVADSLSVAKGTIKRAYDELERIGIVEKVQGRGTFVSYQRTGTGSRKDRAMAAIDEMLDKLEDMGFSAAEINIYLELKLRQWAEQEAKIKIAVLECNSENLAHMTEQLRKIPHVELYSYLLGSIQQYPYRLEEDLDLIVTTAIHAPELEAILPGDKPVIRVALRLDPKCLMEILHLGKGQVLGILGESIRFGRLLEESCRLYAEDAKVLPPQTFANVPDMAAFLQGKDAVLVPWGYEKYCSGPARDALQDFDGELILCGYELDEGSFLYLQEKTKRLLRIRAL